jgi:DNA-binding Lrp family transcriptional regulator
VTAAINSPALALADAWQRGFPLLPEPFAELAAANELSTGEVLAMMQALKDRGVLARIGATVRPNTAGASTLAAMAVPPERLDNVAEVVNAERTVNHNYHREHDINLWFVVTAGCRAEVNATLAAIARHSGFDVLDLPLERAYHIDLGFRLTGRRRQGFGVAGEADPCAISDADRALLGALQDGLPLVARPYLALANRLGWSEQDVLERLGELIECRVITRFGCILRHRHIGYRANAMAVWDVPDDRVDDIAGRLAERDEVTLCYRRTRRLPAWRYNLFAMIHGNERAEVQAQIADAARETGLDRFESAILFSKHCYKQRGACLSPRMKGAA